MIGHYLHTLSAGTAGVHGLLAFWMGGAGAAPSSADAGIRSMLAMWMGGASAYPGSVPPITPDQPGGVPQKPFPVSALRARRIREDEELMLLIAAALPLISRGRP